MTFPRRTFQGISELLNSINTKIQNALLPSGAIVWFKRQTAPTGWTICDGTNGTPNLIGRYPLGATSDIGSTVEAGLPNITGSVDRVRAYGTSYCHGAFYPATGINGNGYVHDWHTDSGGGVVGFDARRSSSVYGNSTTVTPPSVKLLPCMKL